MTREWSRKHEGLNLNLSAIQERALDKLQRAGKYGLSAYEAGESISTLHSLVRWGLAKRVDNLGSVFDPRMNRVNIRFFIRRVDD